MMRTVFPILAAVAIAATPVHAKSKAKPDSETSDSETPRKGKGADTKGKDAEAKGVKGKDARKSDGKGTDGKGKPVQVGTFGDWGAFKAAQGKTKSCYALAQPKERAPAGAKREAAYLFVSNQPKERVSVIMGFSMKDNSNAKAEIGGTTFDLICKGTSAWLEDLNKEDEFIESLKRGSKLVIKASAVKGGLTTDSYSLAGLSDALARVGKECP